MLEVYALWHIRTSNMSNTESEPRSSYRNRQSIIVATMRHLQSHCLARRSVSAGMYFWFELHPSTAQKWKSFLRLYNQAYHIACTLQHWRDMQVKEGVTTLCNANSTDHTWQPTCTRLYDISASEPKPSCRINTHAVTTSCSEWPTAICRQGHRRTTPEDVKRHPVCTGSNG